MTDETERKDDADFLHIDFEKPENIEKGLLHDSSLVRLATRFWVTGMPKEMEDWMREESARKTDSAEIAMVTGANVGQWMAALIMGTTKDRNTPAGNIMMAVKMESVLKLIRKAILINLIRDGNPALEALLGDRKPSVKPAGN